MPTHGPHAGPIDPAPVSDDRCEGDAAWWAAVGVPPGLQAFEPGTGAALRRLQAVRPAEYARSRNAIDGAVTGLSPYLTHGVVSLREAVAVLHARHALDWQHKLVFEFAWREFFHHVWRRAAEEGDAILSDLRPSALGPVAYGDALPEDVREGRTGVPAIDTAVRVLYRSGYLHNHARMWLASYVVHGRKCHWRAGADWMFGHLIDGDLASNHLSWQWVAGSFSSKPYLFNAENVERYAPRDARAAWASHGTAVDRSYEALEQHARHGGDSGTEPGRHAAVEPPALTCAPPADLVRGLRRPEPALWHGRAVEIVHPWSMSERGADSGAFRLGLLHLPAHARWPWSARRWRWVVDHLAMGCDAVHIGDAAQLDLHTAASVHAVPTRFPGYREWLTAHAQAASTPLWLPEPARACASFSRYYAEAQRQSGAFSDLFADTLRA